MKHFLTYFFILALGALAGCTQSRIVIGGDDAGSPLDGGVVQCGTATCTDGLVCCNESCGICTSPGGACVDLLCGPVTCGGETCEDSAAVCCPGCAGESFCSGPGGECPAVDCGPTCGELECAGGSCCTDCDGSAFCSPGACPLLECDPCEAQDARSNDAACALLVGYAWDGVRCEAVLCGCEGSDCDALSATEDACVAEHAACVPTTCEHDHECELDEWCNPCAHGSCPVCADCVQACTPHACATGRTEACRAQRPDCGPSGVAVVDESLCWTCVDRLTCEPLPEDCRSFGCESGSSCQECGGATGTVWACTLDGAAC